MSEEENFQTNTEGINNQMAKPFYGMIEEVRVMLVDHDKKFINEMVDLLKSYKYKVTTVDMASAAMSILSKGKQKIDVMIINVNSPDLLSFQLLAQGVALNIISFVICDEHNAHLAMNALNDGAYLYLEKPLHEDIVKYLWQFVLRKKIQREKEREELVENGDQISVGDADDIGNNNIIGEKNMPINIKEQSNNIDEVGNDVESNEKYKLKRKSGRKNAKDINVVESQSSANKVVKRKVCTEWTVDLHAKFAKAVHQLGEGRCYPKGILKVMNVHGLTRMQVASHLQKCRRNNWRIPEERKYVRHSSGQASSSGSRQRSSFRKFGTMPHLQINNPNLQQQQCNRDQTQRGPESMFPPINTNNSLARGESSTQQQLYRPQIQVQPHYLSIANPFNNQIFLTQNNIAGGLQQLHEPLFGMLGSQGLQNSIIGSTNYGPGLTFNNGNNYIQSDYNLDLNAAHAIHSGSAIIHGTAIGNATFYELEAANATFQQYIGEPSVSYPSNIIAASHASDVKDAYFDFNNMNYLFQNLGPPSANLPNEYGSMLDQVYSNDQVAPTHAGGIDTQCSVFRSNKFF